MTWLHWAGLLLCALAVAAAVLFVFGGWRWAVENRRLLGKLEAGRMTKKQGGQRPTSYNARELVGLPTPVQRYFRAVLKDGQPIIATATLELAGNFNMSPTGEQWKPFTSTQHVVTARPGFLWDARIAMLPGLPVRVIDSYITGEGLLHAALLGLFEVAHVHGRGEIARGELMRFFAEMPWYPTALLPSQGVGWEAVDHRSAHATLVDGRITLKLLFKFNDAGLIESFRASARGSMINKKMVMAPWEGQWSNYQMRDGMTVPLTGEVAWVRPEGRKSYFQGTATSLKYTWHR
jgi:hypothetical protein